MFTSDFHELRTIIWKVRIVTIQGQLILWVIAHPVWVHERGIPGGHGDSAWDEHVQHDQIADTYTRIIYIILNVLDTVWSHYHSQVHNSI